MGTSNWQNIPFGVEVLMRIAPERVLDVGVGFGRWGMLVREFCDVWYGRVLPDEWRVNVEGVEAFEATISGYHSSFYDHIYIGDFADLFPSLREDWNVIILGDVIEHFEKVQGEEVLKWCVNASDYVLVNVPIGSDWAQGECYDNPFERHRSEWYPDDFAPYGLVRQAMFRDYIKRPFASFVLSRLDPKDLRSQLFSCYTRANSSSANELLEWLHTVPDTTADLVDVLSRLTECEAELAALRNSLTWRVGHAIARRLPGQLLRRLLRRVRRLGAALCRPGHQNARED